MEVSRKSLRDALRAKYVEIVKKAIGDLGEEILTTGTNEFCFPCVDEEGNDEFVVVTVKVPTGSRDGDAYDGYGLAQEFEMKEKEKTERKAKAKIEKEKKIARDKAQREAKAKAKAEYEAKKLEQ